MLQIVDIQLALYKNDFISMAENKSGNTSMRQQKCNLRATTGASFELKYRCLHEQQHEVIIQSGIWDCSLQFCNRKFQHRKSIQIL